MLKFSYFFLPNQKFKINPRSMVKYKNKYLKKKKKYFRKFKYFVKKKYLTKRYRKHIFLKKNRTRRKKLIKKFKKLRVLKKNKKIYAYWFRKVNLILKFNRKFKKFKKNLKANNSLYFKKSN